MPVAHDVEMAGEPVASSNSDTAGPASPDVVALPKNNLPLVLFALGLVTFVSAMDQTIVGTALPTIATDLNISASEYSWVGTSYLLAQTIMTPVNGRMTDIIGRKPALYTAIIVLMAFSALAGAAKNATWLIVSRALGGLGGGSIVGLSIIVLSDIVPLNKRGLYQGYMGAFSGVAAVIGPILGGILTDRISWRWCFYINLPICGVALVMLILTLNLNPVPSTSVREVVRTFDFVGLLLLMVGAAMLIVGFSTAADDGFGVPRVYGVIIASAVVIAAAVVHFFTTKRNAIIPARMLKTRTVLFFLFSSFFLSLTLVSTTYLIPQFYQGVRGASAEMSGLYMIPLSAVSAVMSICAGQVTARLRVVRPLCWGGFFLTSLTFGLFYAFFTAGGALAAQEVLIGLAGAGIGMAISPPMLIIQAAMPVRDMAAATSAWVLMRSLAATIVTTALLNAELLKKLPAIGGYGTEFTLPKGTQGYQALHDLPAGPLRDAVLDAFADSFRPCWILACAVLAAALALTLWTKSYSLHGLEAPASTVSQASEDHDEKAQADSPAAPVPELSVEAHGQVALAHVRTR